MCLDQDGTYQGVLPFPPIRPKDHGRNIHIRHVLALGALLDNKLPAAQQLLQSMSRIFRYATVIFQCDLCPQRSQLPYWALGLVAILHMQPLGHTLIELFGNASAIGFLGHLKIQQLALAALPHGQGQDDGDDGMGMVAVAVLDVQLRPGKGALHRAQQIQVRDVSRRAFLDK